MKKIILQDEDIRIAPIAREYIPLMLEIQEEAFAVMDDQDLLRRNSSESLAVCFEPPSGVWGVFKENELIAFGIMYCAGETKENLALDLDGKCDLFSAANVKLIIVRPAYRGNGLQRKLLKITEEYAKSVGISALCATVSPKNTYSLRNFTAEGYDIIKTLVKYGGLERALLVKYI